MAPRPLATVVAATTIGVLVFGAPNLPGLRAAQTPAPNAAAPAFEVASIKQNKTGRRPVFPGESAGRPIFGHQHAAARVDCIRIWHSAAPAELSNHRRTELDRFRSLRHQRKGQHRVSAWHERSVAPVVSDAEGAARRAFQARGAQRIARAAGLRPGDGAQRRPSWPAAPQVGRRLRGALRRSREAAARRHLLRNPASACSAVCWRDRPRHRGGSINMTQLATLLSRLVNRTVVDKTGLTGNFDIDLTFTPDQPARAPGTPPTSPSGPTASTSIRTGRRSSPPCRSSSA